MIGDQQVAGPNLHGDGKEARTMQFTDLNDLAAALSSMDAPLIASGFDA